MTSQARKKRLAEEQKRIDKEAAKAASALAAARREERKARRGLLKGMKLSMRQVRWIALQLLGNATTSGDADASGVPSPCADGDGIDSGTSGYGLVLQPEQVSAATRSQLEKWLVVDGMSISWSRFEACCKRAQIEVLEPGPAAKRPAPDEGVVASSESTVLRNLRAHIKQHIKSMNVADARRLAEAFRLHDAPSQKGPLKKALLSAVDALDSSVLTALMGNVIPAS